MDKTEEENSNLEAKQPPNEPTQSTDDQRERLPMKAMQMRGLVGTILANITVEPYIFLYSLGFGMTTIITPILYMNKICSVGSVIFGNGTTWSHEICDHMDAGEHKGVQEYCQATYANMQTLTLTVKVIPPIIFNLFIGPWSDNCGRKMLILIPITGYIAYMGWFLINVIFFDEMTADWLMLEIFQYWPGGYMCLFLGTYSYLADVSSPEFRTTRIAIFDCVNTSGWAISQALSSVLYTKGGYAGVFTFGLVVHCLALLYGIFFIKETKRNTNTGEKKEIKCLDVFSLRHVKSSFLVMFKTRPDGSRHLVVILVLLFGLFFFCSNVFYTIMTPYIKLTFPWDDENVLNTWLATFGSIQTIIGALSLGLLLPLLSNVLKLNDLLITLICLLSMLAGLVITLSAKVPWVLYIAAVVQVGNQMTTTVLRSVMTKVVSCQDTGKIFAAVGSITAIVSLFCPFMQQVYRATIDWYPGFVFVLCCLMLLFLVAMVIYGAWFWAILTERRKKLIEQKAGPDFNSELENKSVANS